MEQGDLISRKALLEAYNSDLQHWSGDVYDLLMYEIQDAPAVEAEPVRHGRWIEDGDYIICPACRKRWNIMDNDTETFRRCPNCGAKMDLEGDDGT